MDFVVGANLPWIRYGCDFGGNQWHPDGGVADPLMTAELRRLLSTLSAQGLSVVRWFLFCDGRAGIRFDGSSDPIGLDDHVLADLDAALTVAADARVRVMFTLFDFLWCRPRTRVGGVDLGGHRRLFAHADVRAALLERIVAPVLELAGRHPAVWAWDVINEPEWVTFGRGTWHPWALRSSHLRALITDVVTLAHARTTQPVTVGLASARWLGLVRDLDLDFYQVHWYDKLDWLAPLAAPVDRWRLDKPVLLGEFPTRGSAAEPAAILETARAQGYAGALFWSVRSGDAASDYARAAPAVRQFLDRDRELTYHDAGLILPS
jgi:hypothetical protein